MANRNLTRLFVWGLFTAEMPKAFESAQKTVELQLATSDPATLQPVILPAYIKTKTLEVDRLRTISVVLVDFPDEMQGRDVMHFSAALRDRQGRLLQRISVPPRQRGGPVMRNVDVSDSAAWMLMNPGRFTHDRATAEHLKSMHDASAVLMQWQAGVPYGALTQLNFGAPEVSLHPRTTLDEFVLTANEIALEANNQIIGAVAESRWASAGQADALDGTDERFRLIETLQAASEGRTSLAGWVWPEVESYEELVHNIARATGAARLHGLSTAVEMLHKPVTTALGAAGLAALRDSNTLGPEVGTPADLRNNAARALNDLVRVIAPNGALFAPAVNGPKRFVARDGTDGRDRGDEDPGTAGPAGPPTRSPSDEGPGANALELPVEDAYPQGPSEIGSVLPDVIDGDDGTDVSASLGDDSELLDLGDEVVESQRKRPDVDASLLDDDLADSVPGREEPVLDPVDIEVIQRKMPPRGLGRGGLGR